MDGTGKRETAEIELGGIDTAGRPRRENPSKGKTKYPFGAVEVGQVFYVARSASSVRTALHRYLELNKGRRFEIWRGADRRMVVKRTK